MEQETVFKRDEGEISLLDHREKSKKTYFVDYGEIDPVDGTLVKENIDFRWWYTEETEGLLLNRLKALIHDDPMIRVILSSNEEYQSPYTVQTDLFITESRTYHDMPSNLPTKEWYLSAEVKILVKGVFPNSLVPIYTALANKVHFGFREWGKDNVSYEILFHLPFCILTSDKENYLTELVEGVLSDMEKEMSSLISKS